MNIDEDDDDLFGDEAFSSFQHIDVAYKDPSWLNYRDGQLKRDVKILKR